MQYSEYFNGTYSEELAFILYLQSAPCSAFIILTFSFKITIMLILEFSEVFTEIK